MHDEGDIIINISLLDQRFFNQTFGISSTRELEDDLESHLHTFENLCKNEILGMDLSPTKLVQINQFIDIVDRINNRYPFLFVPSFIQDFMSGYYSKSLLEKYHLRNFLELNYIMETILKIKGTRVKGVTSDTLNKNLEHSSWKKIYDIIIENSSIFNNELFEILNQNLLRAFTIIALYEHPNGLTKDELVKNFPNIFESNQNRIKLFNENEKVKSFTKYISDRLSQKIEHILENLVNKKFLREDFSEKRYYLESKYVKIDETILSILSQNHEGIHQDRFHRTLLRELEILKLVPKVGLWEDTLANLEKSKIKRITTFWRYSPYRDQLFLQEDFEKKIKEMREQIVAAGQTKFFGRRISPHNFISELIELEKGDLDDVDDQVTRLAGLILADSIFLQSPHENMKEFDFAVDVSNYEFNSEQIEAMKSVNFSVVGKIMHCKLMINEHIEPKLIEEITKKIPTEHQAVIFTLAEPPDLIKKILPEDKTIQIVSEDGIKAWSAITPVIPCRVNTIAKIMYGNLRGKIVRINGVNYESGIATVSDFNNKEESVYIGSLEEISFGNSSYQKYENEQNNYLEFLAFLAKNAQDVKTFEKAIFEPNIQHAEYNEYSLDGEKTQSKELDLMENEKFQPNPSGRSDERRVEWRIKVAGVETKIKYLRHRNDLGFSLISNRFTTNVGEFLKCGCVFFNEQPYSPKLCSHMISVMDFLGKRLDAFADLFEKDHGNVIKEILVKFHQLKQNSIVEYVYGWLDDEDFENFIVLLNSIWNNNNVLDEINHNDEISNIKEKLIKKINSTEFTDVFKKMEIIVTEMTENNLRDVISDIKIKHQDALFRKKRNHL